MIQQADIFQPLTHNGAFSELCTALYERELDHLAHAQVHSAQGLQRRLQSVPHYVKQAARRMLELPIQLGLDEQNASWQAPQKAKLTVTEAMQKRLEKWCVKQAKLGLALPVCDLSPTLQCVRLDSIDRIDSAQRKLHLNQFGWFDFSGVCLESESSQLRLVSPEKNMLTAAFCGHQWNHRGRTEPRTLSLREILLATTIKWPG
ncbi:hypothetical protein [Pseudidiomarina taiwanensis]|uniref:hypothetical protein n=1 Tax=Pseudidiomarina taiwanensis TaxID=337250 RepID=UPI001F546D44|nr:hypothetical protein [Pseudidiomarina taiwanensis]